jgi:hypothetical protein
MDDSCSAYAHPLLDHLTCGLAFAQPQLNDVAGKAHAPPLVLLVLLRNYLPTIT